MAKFEPLRALITLAVLSTGAMAAIGPVTNLSIVNAEVSPDGFSRSAVLSNGVVDRTVITGNKGDNFQINVVNNLNDNTMNQTTSIHWHGIFQRNTTWADGVAMVSQCPIAKTDSFLYQFTANQAGTYWYHSHLGVQYCDGLRGPLVIYDPQDPYLGSYDVDDESTILTISDWYHVVALQAGPAPTPDSILINGLGRSNANTTAPLAVVNVTQGKKYRMRMINMGCDASYTLQIDGHTSLTVIEVDGVNHQPLVVDEIQIFPGQRYSFVLDASQPIDNYWIRAKPSHAVNTGFNNGFNMAILRYSGANETDPTTTQDNSTNPLVEQHLVPLENVTPPGTPVPGGADTVYPMAIGFTNGRFTINNASFVPPTVPVLLQILSGTTAASSLLPSGSFYNLPPNAVVELTISAGGPGAPHPFHLHGHTFYVIQSAGNSTPNYINPPQRDVLSTGTAGQSATIRFVADNAGPWFLHCHIDWHLNAGLAVVMAEDTGDVAQSNPVPAAWNDLCPIYDALGPGDL